MAKDLRGNIGGCSYDLFKALIFIYRQSDCEAKIAQFDLEVTVMVFAN